MSHERLLERLQILGICESERNEAISNTELTSIIKHLQKLLNTRQGSVEIAPDYGVPDMTNIPGESLTGAGRRMERVLTEVLGRYEPRLANVKVHMEGHQHTLLELRFKLEATLARQPEIPVIFETVIQNSGNITIRL